MFNLPGTVIRADDETLSAPYRRLVASELSEARIARGPVFVGNVFERIIRGSEVSLIHWVELDGTAIPAHLFKIDELPVDLVDTDRPRIRMAAAHYLANRFT